MVGLRYQTRSVWSGGGTADTLVLGTSARKGVRVRISPGLLIKCILRCFTMVFLLYFVYSILFKKQSFLDYVINFLFAVMEGTIEICLYVILTVR